MEPLTCACHNSINCKWCNPQCVGCIHYNLEKNKIEDIDFDKHCWSCASRRQGKLFMTNYKKRKNCTGIGYPSKINIVK